MKPRGDGEPRADGEGSHWFCGCVPGTQECHCHDCLLASRDEARAVVTKLNDLNEGLLATIDQLRSERDEAREVLLARKDALMFFEGLTQRLLEERRSALQERDRLRAALEQYGRHETTCDWWARQIEELVCTCGFSEALNESEKAVSSD